MDVIKGLPKVHRKFVILTVVDRIYAHFIALGHLYTAASVARVFFEGIVCLHGFPTFIVNDRDPVFTSNMWHDLFKQAGVKFLLSTAFNTQMDGQSEVVNKVIATLATAARSPQLLPAGGSSPGRGPPIQLRNRGRITSPITYKEKLIMEHHKLKVIVYINISYINSRIYEKGYLPTNTSTRNLEVGPT